jgi:hypothetical protein
VKSAAIDRRPMGPSGTVAPGAPLDRPEGFHPLLLEEYAVKLASSAFRCRPGRGFSCAAAYLLQ